MVSKDYEWRANRMMPIVSTTVIEYAFGARGRVFDLPKQYQDAIIEANTYGHPRTLDRRITELMASGRFRPSSHPSIKGMTLADLRAYQRSADTAHMRTYRAKHGKRKRVAKPAPV